MAIVVNAVSSLIMTILLGFVVHVCYKNERYLVAVTSAAFGGALLTHTIWLLIVTVCW
jgi:hypothetical protein